MIAGAMAGVIMEIASPGSTAGDSAFWITWWGLLLWVPVEGLMLSGWGTTPGKALMRVRIRREDGWRVSVSQGSGRAFRAWLFGLGTGVPLISLFTMLYHKSKLSSDGETSWDRECSTRVEHGGISGARWAAILFALMGTFVLMVIGAAADL